MSKHYKLVTALNDTDFGQKAADVLIDLLHKFSLKVPKVILPTGKTPQPMYEALRERGRDALPRMEYYQLDEYLGLPAEHPALFLNQMRKDLLDPLEIPVRLSFNIASQHIEKIGVQLDAISARFSFSGHPDIAVIGIGQNGHVGFNEPHTSFDEGPHVVSLSKQTIDDNSRGWDVEKLGAFPQKAITLGIKDLMRARHTVLLVTGEHKAGILHDAFFGPVTSMVPASYLQDQPNVTIVADNAALSKMNLS